MGEGGALLGSLRVRRALWLAVCVLSWTYLSVALAFVTLRLTTGDRFGLVLLSIQTAHVWLLPALPLAAVALLKRQPRRGLASIALATVWVFDCGTWALPARAAVSIDDRQLLRVVTWNLAARQCDPDEVAEWLLASDADYVLMQETKPGVHQQLVERLQDSFPYSAQYDARPSRYSKAWFARSAPVRAEFFGVAVTPYVSMEIEFDGAPLRLFDVHARVEVARDGPRDASHEDILSLARTLGPDDSGLLVGDFNTTERSPFHRRIVASGLVDSYREAESGPGFTFPCDRDLFGVPAFPLLRIDYLWHSADLECLEVVRGPNAGSDHLPLLGVFRRREAIAGN